MVLTRRIGSWEMYSANVLASGSVNRTARMADVSITILESPYRIVAQNLLRTSRVRVWQLAAASRKFHDRIDQFWPHLGLAYGEAFQPLLKSMNDSLRQTFTTEGRDFPSQLFSLWILDA